MEKLQNLKQICERFYPSIVVHIFMKAPYMHCRHLQGKIKKIVTLYECWKKGTTFYIIVKIQLLVFRTLSHSHSQKGSKQDSWICEKIMVCNIEMSKQNFTICIKKLSTFWCLTLTSKWIKCNWANTNKLVIYCGILDSK